MLLPVLLVSARAHAGPWVKDPGHAYLKAGYLRFSAGEYVDPTGGSAALAPGEELPRYLGHTHHLYAEVGLIEHLQLVANLPFVGSRNTLGDTAYVNRAFGDADVGLAVGDSFGHWPVALSLSSKLPLYDNNELLQYGNISERFPAIGDGQVDLTAMASVGRGFSVSKLQGWTALEAGYRHRTEWWLGDSGKPDRTLVDGIPWHAQLGWSPAASDRSLGWVSVDASGIQNLGSSEHTKQWTQLGVGLGALIAEGFALELGVTSTPIAKGSSKGWSASSGVSWQR